MSVVNVFVAPIVLDLMDLKNKYIDYWLEKIQYFKPCGKKRAHVGNVQIPARHGWLTNSQG